MNPEKSVNTASDKEKKGKAPEVELKDLQKEVSNDVEEGNKKESEKKENWKEKLLTAANRILKPQEYVSVVIAKKGEYETAFGDLAADTEKMRKNEEMMPFLEAPQSAVFEFVRTNPDMAFQLFFEKAEGKENTYTVNFRGVNENLLGLGHFDAFTKNFPYAKVNNTLGGRGAEQGFHKLGYFNKGNYLRIFSGDIIEGFSSEQVAEEEKNSLKPVEMDWSKWKEEADIINNQYQKNVEVQEKDERALIEMGAEPLSGNSLLNNPEFSQKLNEVCEYLGVSRSDMITVMKKESGINTKAINGDSNATGLIQFMPSTALDLGTSVAELRVMSGVEQLDYVQKYFENYRGRMRSVADLYLVTFYPVALNKPMEYIIGSERGMSYAEKVARLNKGINGGRLITKGDFVRYAVS